MDMKNTSVNAGGRFLLLYKKENMPIINYYKLIFL